MGLALLISCVCCAGDDAGTQVKMKGADGVTLISNWASQAASLLPGMGRASDTATGLDTICEALVRIGKPNEAMTLYRQAFPDKERTKPDNQDQLHITIRCRTSILGQQIVVALRQGSPVDDLLAECESTAEPISLAEYGKHSFRSVRWPMVVALSLGGRVEDSIRRAVALRDTDLDGWDMAELLAAGWRCGYREQVERETVRLLKAEPSWRFPFARWRLDGGDLVAAKLLASELSGREADDFREALAFRLPESVQDTRGLRPEWKVIAADHLIQARNLAGAAQLMRGQPYDNTSWVSILCSFHSGDTQPVAKGFSSERNLCERIERFSRIMTENWTGEQQQQAAHILRRELIALRPANGEWPWDTDQEYAYSIAILAIEGEWGAIATTLEEMRRSEIYSIPYSLRAAVIELTRAKRIALAEDLQRRFAIDEGFERCGAWIAGEYVQAGDLARAEAAFAALRTPGGRFEALTNMIRSATLHWLGRPQAYLLDWMDAKFGL